MFDLNELKKFLKENPEELSAILDSDRSSVLNAPEVKLLHSKYLTNFWNDRPNKLLTYIIFFSEKLIEELNFENIKDNLSGPITETLKLHRSIQVDNDFRVVSSSSKDIEHDYCIDLSNRNNVVFFFGEEGIDVIVKGKIIPRINVFYDESDRVKYYKKYHITDIATCLKDYEKHIKEPGINEIFFASKNVVVRIKPINPPNNTLINKPESIMRNNLISFLNHNTQHSFLKENELNNRRELDLYTEVEGKKYLIEVKWLGQSLNDNENGFTQKVSDFAARDGVTQTLEYIKQLLEEMNFNVHCGFLCVFDAREIKNPINYQNFDFVTNDLLPYFKNYFIKLDEIPLSRNP